MGKLYICPTPIGNLEDITLRVIRVLSEVDFVAAEDTRRTLNLLNHLEIKKKLYSFHEHNRMAAAEKTIGLLKEGNDIALVSDAGMPLISDPGDVLVRRLIEENIEFEVLPGPTAFVNALILSGFSSSSFLFVGFLPRKKKELRQELERIRYVKDTLIFYEAPHRIKDTLKSLRKELGNRKVSLSRELTKKFEETIRLSIDDLLLHFGDSEVKGEIVLIVEGSSEEPVNDNAFEHLSIREHIELRIGEGLSKKDAVKAVAKERNLPKNEVYKESLDI